MCSSAGISLKHITYRFKQTGFSSCGWTFNKRCARENLRIASKRPEYTVQKHSCRYFVARHLFLFSTSGFDSIFWDGIFWPNWGFFDCSIEILPVPDTRMFKCDYMCIRTPFVDHLRPNFQAIRFRMVCPVSSSYRHHHDTNPILF